MSKKIITINIILLAVIIIFLASCKNSLLVGNPLFNKVETGSLTVSLSSESPRTILPAIDMTMSTFNISGTGPDSAVFSSDGVAGTTYTAENLITGSWSITADALNESGVIVMTGTVNVEIISGDNTVTVDVYPLTGNGSVGFTLSWSAGVLSVADTEIVSSFTPAGGSPTALTFTISDGEAICTQEFAPGYYQWDLRVEELGQVCYRMPPEVVRIVTSEETTHSLDLSGLIELTPSDNDTVSDSTPFINWYDFPDAISYIIQISDVENDFTSSPEISIDLSEYQTESELSLVTYYWRVRPVYAGEVLGEWSGPWNFTIQAVR
jgi:hypothetical protein